MLEELSCENRVVGLKQTRRLLAAGHAGRVFLAKDADPALVEPLLAACRAVGVPCRDGVYHVTAGPGRRHRRGDRRSRRPQPLKRVFPE